jgi:hypothetical protein
MADIRGLPQSGSSVFGVFYPKCPSCEVAPVVDGWCHHIDADQDARNLMQSEYGNRRDYCGFLVNYGKCPLEGK